MLFNFYGCVVCLVYWLLEGKERVWLSYEEAMVKMGEDGVVEGGIECFFRVILY